MTRGTVHGIFLATRAKQPLEAAAEAAPRRVSLIEREALDAVLREDRIDLHQGRSRRNLVTEGIALTALKGQTFRIGTAVLRGVGLCQPCAFLERLTVAGAFAALKGRGGLHTEVLVEGALRMGDTLELRTERNS